MGPLIFIDSNYENNCNMWRLTNKYIFYVGVRCGSHWGGSPQNGLGNEQTCGTTLASAYVLCHLSAA